MLNIFKKICFVRTRGWGWEREGKGKVGLLARVAYRNGIIAMWFVARQIPADHSLTGQYLAA